MRVQRLLGLGEAAARRVRNQLAAPGFSERAGRNGLVPNGGIAVFFGTGPDNLYQFEQWRRPLERLAEDRAVFVIVDQPDTGDLVLDSSSLPVAFARGSAALEELVSERDVRVVLYLNQVEPNFRMLRFAAPVHIQIGHGESDKGGSVSNQHKAYDLTFVGGDAGRDRLQRELRRFDAGRRTVGIGRPQLDHDYPGAPDWAEGTGLRVWYAPTWEGDRPSIEYGSLASHGVAIIDALLAEEDVRVIYRPHPRTGRASAEHSQADKIIRGRLAQAGGRHLVDEGEYGWQWAFADACVTDISAVAHDWLATGKPLVITEPENRAAYRPSSPLLDALPLLAAADAGSVVARVRATPDPRLAELASYYFGEVADGASSLRFAAAIDAALAEAAAR